MRNRERVVPIQPIFLANLRDHVHHNLRDAIVAGKFNDGERLHERELAREMGVSTTPLKEALRQLEAEGLVRTEARRGIYVTFGAKQAEEMSLARAALESMIARLAAKRASRDEAERLHALVREMENATVAGDVSRLIELNEAFHSRIHDASGCEYLRRLQAKQQMYNHTTRIGLLGEPKERGRALIEHRAIADAIAAGDQDSAERVMRDHIVRSGQRHVETVFGHVSTGEVP